MINRGHSDFSLMNVALREQPTAPAIPKQLFNICGFQLLVLSSQYAVC
jgi:hypothetical protein